MDDRRLRIAVASHLLTSSSTGAARLAGRRARGRVVTVNESVLRTAYAGTGAVVALPPAATGSGRPWPAHRNAGGHRGRAAVEAEYAAFMTFREGLGMTVLSHRHPAASPADGELGGPVVCLLADRDLPGNRLRHLQGQPITLPAGPRSGPAVGAALIPAVFQSPTTDVIVSARCCAPDPAGRAGGHDPEVATFFARTLPSDRGRHMMQPFFGGGRAGCGAVRCLRRRLRIVAGLSVLVREPGRRAGPRLGWRAT